MRSVLLALLLVLAAFSPVYAADDVSSLPLVERRATQDSSGLLVILITGDGGWSRFDDGVARSFVDHHISVVGLSSLKFFWHKRTPESTAAAVAAIARHYIDKWHTNRLLLSGYSFGADVIPAVLNRMPADVADHVVLSVLLGPSHEADFQFHVTSWLGNTGDAALPTVPELQKLKGRKIVAFYGEDETESLCDDVPPDLIKCIQLKGGHHFNNDYDTIVQQILPLIP
jgi:type IV secretory pathway VirJ component